MSAKLLSNFTSEASIVSILASQTTSINCESLYIITTSFAFQIQNYILSIISFILLVLFPFETFFVTILAINFLFLRNWTNPSKIYYYIISISNVIGLIFQDITWLLVNLIGLLYGNSFLPFYIPLFMMKIMIINGVVCSLFYFLRDISQMFQIWTVCILSIHRMLIVLFPFKATIIKTIFIKWVLILILTASTCLYIPDFFVVKIYYGTYCANFADFVNYPGYSFWYTYYYQLKYIVYIAPLVLMSTSLSITIYKMKKAAKIRKEFAHRANNSKHNLLERRSNFISITINSLYLLGLGPYAFFTIFLSYLNNQNCTSWSYYLYPWIYNLITVLTFEQMTLRLGDAIVFLLMIPELHRSFEIFKCKVTIFSQLFKSNIKPI